MKYILKIAILASLLGMMFSCSRDFDEVDANLKNSTAGSFADGIEIGLAFPDMQAVSTRTMGNTEPVLTDLDIFLFVFDGNSLKQTIHIPAGQAEWADINAKDDNTDGQLKNRIKFTAYLPQTKEDAVIHFVALDDTDGEFAKQVDAVGYGLEDVIMPKFNVSGNQDAYWQRIDLECSIICSVDNNDDSGLEDVVGTETEVGDKLKLVQLVRNFAEIDLIKDESVGNFTILGWTVVNDLDGGSITPWFSPSGQSEIIYPKFVKNGVISNYDDLVAQGYPGVSFAGAQLRNTLTEVSNKGGNNWGTGPKYLYDRKVVSVNPLYILIYGSLQGNPGYYKVSLSNRDKTTGLVSEYNVIRNIRYTIRITGVTAEGYMTPEEAAAGPAFNNISGDVTTRSLLQISDGVDMLYVNFVTYIVTQKDQEVIFRYRFLENILKNNGTERNTDVIWKAANDNAGVGLKTTAEDSSAVVTLIEGPADTVDKKTRLNWTHLKLKFIEPTEELKEQKFIVYTPPKTYDDGTSSVGLSRTINLIVRVPWDYERLRIYPGNIWNQDTFDKFPEWTPKEEGIPGNNGDDGEIYIGPNQGDEFALFFELPAGLPESMFPMEFIIESDRQNIENAGIENAVVQNGESLFKSDQGVNDLRIQYVKTILWSDYAPDGIKSTPGSRVVRVRFVTTTNMSTYPTNVTSITTTVRIHNPAFNDADYKFTRKKGQPATSGETPTANR